MEKYELLTPKRLEQLKTVNSAVPALIEAAEVAFALRSALERLKSDANNILRGRVVRSYDETLAEVDSALTKAQRVLKEL